MSPPIVELDRVSIVFGDAPAMALPLMDRGLDRAEILEQTGQTLGVHDCTLSVAEGEIVVLMGLSGSGKSTLIRAVNGLNPVVRGVVRVFDGDRQVDVARADMRTLRHIRNRRVAMVFQQFALLPWRSVLENVSLGLELRGMPAAERAEAARRQLELVGLADWSDRQVHELSGGMQQRVGLARAFATDAPILLMDEPFSALDPLIRNKLQDELLDFQRDMGRTILFVSHDLDEAMKIGNRIAIMEGGRIVQVGTPQQIVMAPKTHYVAEFVAHMNPLNVLRAREVMQPATDTEADARAVAPDTPVREIMGLQGEAVGPVVVVQDGRVVGRITLQDVVRALLAVSDVTGD
jgi:glycine betaine/proline transport system ATP-binding protein